MIRDPFYRKIIERLEDPLDPDLFEACAADLLRTSYPSLVPIPGGTHSGMDGAIADGAGEPFPLVTTTSEDVIGNLTRNLKSYAEHGGNRRKVVLATSRHLTPRRRENLFKRAAELGFTLTGIHAQEAIANLLYQSPRWCRDLLDLTGDPSPLSVIPQTERPLLDDVLVGREPDLDWLRQSTGDRLLVGQPGSGKTFLLYKLALDGNALFVVSRDRGEIAAAIRSEQPAVLIVDDAQLQQGLLGDLRHLREDIGAGFSILASCWPSDQDAIAESLNLANAGIHQLAPLTRDETVQIIKAVGLDGPDRLIHEIVNQAEGLPGLAVTLAHLCLRGGVREVVLGDALNRSVSRFFEHTVGLRASTILAAFSVGGNKGMPLHVVAQELGMNIAEVRDALVKLAAGGVIREVGRDCLSVRPPALREVLVRNVFFTGAMSLPITTLLARVPVLSEAARTLIGATARGGRVPQSLLIEVLEQAGIEDVWREYAYLGQRETAWILDNHPEKAVSIAWPALHYCSFAHLQSRASQ